MFSQLKKITDERSMLLMYLAGELSAPDREEVERRLAKDARLAAELADLQASHASYLEMMSILEAATPPAVPDAAAAQRANRAIRQWATRRLANPLPAARANHFLPRWVYPMAAAAAMVVAVIWWGVDSGFKRIEDREARETPKYAIDQLEKGHQNLEGLVDAVVDDGSAGDETATGDAATGDTATGGVEEDHSVAAADSNDDINLFLGLTDESGGKGGTP
jgi:anti-sigma-K factor RskA